MTPTPRRILFIIDWFHRTGGTEKHLAQLVAGLKAWAFDSTVVVFDRGENPLLEGMVAGGVPVIHLPVGREYVPNALLQAWRLSRLIRRQRYDIVQTYHQKADTYGALIARAAGVRHLVSSKRDTGQLRSPLHTFLNRRLSGLFEAIIMAAEGVRSAVAARDRLDAGRRIVTIYNGVDTRQFRPPQAAERAAARTRLGFGEGDFVVGMVAGLRPEKNHDVLLAAIALLAPQLPGLRVLLVGAGPLLEHYRAQVARGPLDGPDGLPGGVRVSRRRRTGNRRGRLARAGAQCGGLRRDGRGRGGGRGSGPVPRLGRGPRAWRDVGGPSVARPWRSRAPGGRDR